MKHFISICLCILCFAGCRVAPKDSDLLIIPVDVRQNSPVKLSEIAENIKKIELETSDECLVGRIMQVLCVDDRIYVSDAQGGTRIHVFDLSGKFLFAINKRGQGPGEYLMINGITADTVNKHLYVASWGNKIIRYNLDDGSFIDELTNLSSESISFNNDFLHAFLVDMARQIEENKYITTTIMVRYNRNLQPIDTIEIKKVILNRVTGTIFPGMDFISQDNQNNMFVYYPVLLNEPVARDTLYILNENQLKPYAKLKFSDENNTQRNKSIYSITRTSNLLIVEYVSLSDREKRYFCCDFKSKTGKNMLGGFLDDVYNTGLAEIRLLNNDSFYFVKEVEDVPDLYNIPNPVLYIGKLKD